MRHGPSALRLIALLVAVAATAAAQEEPKPRDLPDAPAAKPDSAPQKHQNPYNTTIEVLGRRPIFFPNIATSVGPLSSKQKFELFADESVAPSRFLSSAFGAGIGQAQNSLEGYGQELGGYGKRFGSSMATAASNNFFGTFLIASLLHRDPRYFEELGGYGKRFVSSMVTSASNNFFGTFLIASLLHRDPRYFVTLHGGAGHRIGYALSRIVVSRKDDGRDAANWPGILGPLLAESLASSYHPCAK